MFLDGFLTFLIWLDSHWPECELLLKPKIANVVIHVKWGMCLCGLQTMPLGAIVDSINIPCHGILGGITNLCSTNNGGLHCIKPKPCFVHKKHLKEVAE
jgi:hypothetical protein